jgi:predicted MPP superfamily phosphohydrolase
MTEKKIVNGDARGDGVSRVKKQRWRDAAGVVAVTMAVWSTLVEPGAVAVREVALRRESWPQPLAGLRIAVLGDIHAGATSIVPVRFAVRPEVVLLTLR